MINKVNDQKELQLRTENDLRNALLKILKSNGLHPRTEIPFLSRSLDVVYRCTDGSITVIEVKRSPKHIRRALYQAKMCLPGASKVYVCTLQYNMTERLKNAFRDIGVGLIFLSPKHGRFSMHYIIPAGRNGRKRGEYTSILRKALKQY